MRSRVRRVPSSDLAHSQGRRILDAAEVCFVRRGFHRATIQDVADKAEMSVGNLYRYFKTKIAVVRSLPDRHRDNAIGHIAADVLEYDEILPALWRIMQVELVGSPREKMVLWVEIWAEATRDVDIGALQIRLWSETNVWLVDLLRRSSLHCIIDHTALATLIATVTYGMIVNRAILPGYDPQPVLNALIANVEHALQPAMSEPADAACCEPQC